MTARFAIRPSMLGAVLMLSATTASLSGPASASVTVTQARTATASCSGWAVVPSPVLPGGTLSAVAATSAKDVWAVGSSHPGNTYRTLIEHWDGAAWSVVPSPNPATGASPTDTLGGVVAISAKNAWAFGFYEKTTTSFRTLIEHWNGIRWSVVPSPNSGTGENALAAAVARSATDIWAVGYRNNPGHRRTLTEHWNGHAWSIVASPSVGTGDSFLFGAAAAPGGPIWAVGTDPVSFNQTLALRWNGHAWTVSKTANPGDGDRFLQGVAAPSARYALTVGSDLAGSKTRALAERWTGSGWSVVPSASPGADYNTLQAIAARSASDAWAVGARRSTPGAAFRTLAEHWNGTAWTAVASPSPGGGADWLYGVAAVPGGGLWAVGKAGAGTLTEFHC